MWSELISELDQWTALGATATFWWRDDDAEMPSPQLDAMLAVAGSHPLSLAVVPGNRDLKPLAQRLAGHNSITIFQHGWKHANNPHAPHGEHISSAAYAATWQTPTASLQRQSEYPEDRAFAEVVREIGTGQALLRDAFGQQLLPVFVPPCHLYSDRFLPILAAHGVAWISRIGPRQLWGLGLGVQDVNVHVDLMDWRTRGIVDYPPPFRKIEIMISHLRARRLGHIDIREPTGIYTHHLYQDAKSWKFIAEFLAVTDTHKSTKWLSARDIFSPDGVLSLPSAATDIPRLLTSVCWNKEEKRKNVR